MEQNIIIMLQVFMPLMGHKLLLIKNVTVTVKIQRLLKLVRNVDLIWHIII